MRHLSVFLVVSLAACGCGSTTGGTGGGSRGGGGPGRAATCTPGGLETARSVALRLPQGCRLETSGGMPERTVIGTAESLASVLTCDGNARPSLDLTTHDLVLVPFSMSPAYGGSDVLDDGTTVTIVSRFRPPCEGDPMPMPMQSVHAFVLPKGASRVYREASCSLPEDCD
ncbi:MAG: hypothetical protein IT379_17480 [Deltaproteobacteria bacterium]|nr:hypothetical protein [Deltaproteobacteria bacterium]